MNEIKTVKGGVWVVNENTALNSLTITEGASLAPPEGKNLTMTVDGIGTPIKPGTYKGEIFITVTDKYFMPAGGLFRKGGQPREMRAAVLIENSKYMPDKSVPAIVRGGKVTDKALDGASIYGYEDNFNGIIICGDSDYNIDNLKLFFDGNGSNDFIGLGAGTACIGNLRVTINNSDIRLKSVTRCAIHAVETV